MSIPSYPGDTLLKFSCSKGYWFSQGLFGVANSQIPMVNIWDDHDIIDGFGSYPSHFNGCPVFSGLGRIAQKHYLLFQHHTRVYENESHEPSWIIGTSPGPYITERSRSVFMFMGRKVAFLGLDCRTERQVIAFHLRPLFPSANLTIRGM